jgi:small-conductance mechanosensitive channel
VTPVDLLAGIVNSTMPQLNFEPSPDFVGRVSIANALIFFIILAFAFILGKLVAIYLKKRYSHQIKKDRLNRLILLVRVAIFMVGFFIAAPTVFETSMFFLGLILAGVIIAIAFSSAKILADFVAGIALFYDHPIKIGDFVEIGMNSGTVEEIRLLSTVLRTENGVYVRIPNDEIYTTNVNNYHSNAARRFDYDVGIRYEDDIGKAVEVLENLFGSYTHILKNPRPEVFVSSFDTSSVQIRFRLWLPAKWVNTIDGASFNTSILQDVKKTLENNGIQIAFPQQVVWFGDETLRQGFDRGHL